MSQRENEGKKEKDIWDKLDVIFKVIASLLVAVVSVVASIYLHNKQQTEVKAQLYTQLTSSRETADSDLRKAMFDTIIKDLLQPEPERIPDRVLALEMLTYNFHDVIALGPLFKQLEIDITEDSGLKQQPEKQQQLQGRLRKVALEVSDKQLAALKKGGVIKEEDVYFEDLKNSPSGITVMDKELSLPNGEGVDEQPRKFFVHILEKDDNTRQLLVHLEVFRPGKPRDREIYNTFWVSFSDFPMIENTRLENGDRVAVVLRRWEKNSAELYVAYFPGSRASLKDKMYYDEVVKQLLATTKP